MRNSPRAESCLNRSGIEAKFARFKILASVLAWAALLLLVCAPSSLAQTAGTGAITGTVTDASGGAVGNGTVTCTNKGTNQSRDAKTGADGVYKFTLLPPGDYRMRFTATGFKSTEVESIVVNVTETESLNQVLQVGAVTESVTVESTVETLQTESSTLGTTISGNQITALPMANGNYTEILSLSAGTVAGADNASSLGKGTQNISANGVEPGSNNFQMDGVAVNNIANSGNANDGTIYTGIPIPSPDAIQEFKVQTSTYDASYGRNPGANVVVNTKSGTNAFHGSAFEFLRNTALNANDYLFKNFENHADVANKRAAFNQNQFGGTIGGPIKKDKLWFFFSYRGTRAKNGVAFQSQTFGASLPPALDNYAALGSRGTCGPAIVPDYRSISSVCDATAQGFASNPSINITNIVALRIFQLQTGNNAGVKNGYYIPAPSSYPCTATGCGIDVPAIYHENQYVANGDWQIDSKNALSLKYFLTKNPQTLYVGQSGGNLPGTPEYLPFGNHAAVAKLTSTLSNTFINEVRLSYQRNLIDGTEAMPPGGLASQLGIQTAVPNFDEPPVMIDVIDNFTMFGGLFPTHGPTNQLQAADQISWLHGKHSIRAGFENEWTNWPLTFAGLQQGLMPLLGLGLPPFPLFGLPGLADGGNTSPAWEAGMFFTVEGTTKQNGIVHFYQLNNRNLYVLDDWKVSPRLTLNMGLRWEYFGLMSDKYGRLSQVWLDRMAPNSVVPLDQASALASPLSIQHFVVPSNYDVKEFGQPPTGVGIAPNIHTITGHAPYSNFAPRFGFAWQPLSSGKLVVRGGAGLFYSRIGLDFIVHAYETGSPYGATYDYPLGSSRWLAATAAQPYPHIQLVCVPTDPNCNADGGPGFPARFSDASTGVESTLSAELNPNSVHTPLVQEYSLGVQYEFAPSWVLDLGYVGSTGINLNDYNHNHNQPILATPTNAYSSLCTGPVGNETCNTFANAPFRVPFVGYSVFGLQSNDTNGYSNYNSLQVSVRHQFGHGLSMLAAFTWDNDLSTIFVSNTANINEALCMSCQYGRVNFDRPKRFVVNYSYDLPFGKGMQGFAGKALGGWNVSGITIAQTGDALTFIASTTGAFSSTGPGGSGVPIRETGTAFGVSTFQYVDGVSTAQFCPGFNAHNAVTSGSMESRIGALNGAPQEYFNPAAFCPGPALGPGAPFYGDGLVTNYGNAGVGDVRGPSQFNWDISLQKNTKLTERFNLQFRTDFYNAFNHPQFGDPVGLFGGAPVGLIDVSQQRTANATITRMAVNPRLIQFGLHLIF